jgi:Flp pilus assembly protein protease CpaA
MVYEIVFATITTIVLLVAAYTDIKTREVPDWISYAFIFSALGLRILFSFQEGWQFLVSGLVGFLIFFLLALLFYYTKQWGGADSKLLMGLGAVLGADFIFAFSDSNGYGLLMFFLLLLFVGAIYGLIWSVCLAVLKWKAFVKAFRLKLKERFKEHLIVLLISFLLLFTLLISPALVILAIFPLFSFYLFIFVGSVEDSCFIKKILPGKVTEGDWLAQDVVVNGKTKMFSKTIEREDLLTIWKLAGEGKIKRVVIKEGIPFVPSLLLAYLLLLYSAEFFPWLMGMLF